ncbi:hypothetical protein [Streptomyces sp. 184]|uniref:hypothetical protein n=1 Tax=Streptomyces sp. 184 TaxID=1827526 RepID=UPI003892615A
MLSDDELDRMLRDSDPHPASTATATATDPESPTAVRILARVRRRTRRQRRFRVIVPVVALAVVGATAGTYAWVAGDGQGHTLDSSGLNCVGSSSSDAVMNFNPVTQDPVRECRSNWEETFGKPAPAELTACVDSSQQGSIKVYPGGREQCARHRADVYRGPTGTQLALGRFRTDIEAHFAGRTCVTYPELRKGIDKFLTKHGLHEWSTRLHSSGNESADACAEVVYYDEPERTVYIWNHEDGDPIIWP